MNLMVRLTVGAVLASLAATGAIAQTAWPSKPIKIIVPFAAGGGTDISARHLQPILAEQLGQTVIIENKPGAGGIIGTETLVRSPPDGHTIGMVVSSHVSNPALNKSMPYDALKDVKPITILFKATNVWVAYPKSPYKTVNDVLEAAKKAAGKFAVVTSGNGTQQHLGLEQLKLATDIDMVHVPYKGAGQAANDLVIGQVDVGILNMSSMLAYIKDGRLRGLAVTEGKRSTYAPELPSIAEIVPGFNSVEWFAFVAPAGVPDNLIEQIYQAIVKAARTPVYAEKVKQMGVDLVLNPPAALRAQMVKEHAGFAELVEKAKIKID